MFKQIRKIQTKLLRGGEHEDRKIVWVLEGKGGLGIEK